VTGAAGWSDRRRWLRARSAPCAVEAVWLDVTAELDRVRSQFRPVETIAGERGASSFTAWSASNPEAL